MYQEPKTPIFKRPFPFPGITVLVPPQVGIDVVAVEKGSIPGNIPDQPPVFTRIRYIANIALYDKADVERLHPITDFDPPIEVRVGYTIQDVMRSGCNIESLKLAYWDGSQWVILNHDPIYEYLILRPDTAQVAEAKIGHWAGDPPLAWGT
jgi:hypothetical protein